jgi:type II secretory pathway predicted ATPase ExeA
MVTMHDIPFGLTQRPFSNTPNLNLYFPSRSHEAVVQSLSQALIHREPAAVVEGLPGTGKTVATLRFLSLLSDDVPTVFIPAPRFSRPADLFQAILFDLGIAHQGLTEQELRLAVAHQLMTGLADSSPPTVIAIDEAHLLSGDILEEVRLLGNYESGSAKAAFVVLCGLPQLRHTLNLPEAASLSQRIVTRCTVEPLNDAEATAFLRHQFQVSGGDPDELLTAEAAELLVAHGHGLPRLLNQAATMALTITAAAGESRLDAESVLEALTRLGWTGESTECAVADPPTVTKPIRGRKRRAA